MLHAAEQLRPDVQEKRLWWDILVQSQPWDRLVFLDETGADTKMARRYGWGEICSRVIDHVPHGHWKTSTFVAAMRVTGLTAPLMLDGPMDGESFLAYVKQFLVPTLRPGDIVVMDNLGSHKQTGVVEAIAAAGGHAFYLPPYSPDLNPIEKVFSKLKSQLRHYAERTTESLWNRIGTLVETFTPAECANLFRHCGYSENHL